MSDNAELNSLLQKLYSSVKNTYDISGMIRELKDELKNIEELKNKEVYDKPLHYEIVEYENGMKNDIYGIKSVKRKLDNEVFTIGDKTTYGVIERFYIEGTWGINVHFTNGCGGTLSSLIKDKEVSDKDYSERPPLGLKPFKIHIEHRVQEINDAIERYYAANLPIPKEWKAEKESLDATINSYTKEPIKDYEILTFAEKDWNEIEHYKKGKDGLFRNFESFPYSEDMLIEKYPIFSVKRLSDNSVWTFKEITEQGEIGCFYENNGSLYVGMDNLKGVFNINDIQKVKEPNYEIVSVIDEQQDVWAYDALDEHSPDFRIFSVRRKSDNSVFSIGDKSSLGKIQEFIISDFGVYAVMEFGKKNINDIQKVKEQIIWSKDYNENPIYEGGKYWYVKDWLIRKCTYACGVPDKLMFISEESANDYILLNKTCLSVADLLHLWCLDKPEKERLKELAGKKINNQ